MAMLFMIRALKADSDKLENVQLEATRIGMHKHGINQLFDIPDIISCSEGELNYLNTFDMSAANVDIINKCFFERS